MTEEKRTIHVLKDEKLGVDREYVAVDRDAEVGDTVVVTKSDYDVGEIYEIGHYGKVHTVHGYGEINADFNGFDNSFVDDDGKWFVGDGECSEYHVLEPTDIVHIDDERYRLEDRKAEVGEEVIAKNVDGKWPKLVSDVTASHRTAVSITKQLINDSWAAVIDHGYYYVLTPVPDASEPKESDVITVLANLGAEVAELKRTVARHQAEINALHEDKVRLGEQLAKVVAAGNPKALSLTADELAQLIVSLERAGR